MQDKKAIIANISELKDLIIFAREQKLKKLKIGEIELEVSDLAHIEATQALEMGQSINPSVSASIGSLLEGIDREDPEDEELLYHSARP